MCCINSGVHSYTRAGIAGSYVDTHTDECGQKEARRSTLHIRDEYKETTTTTRFDDDGDGGGGGGAIGAASAYVFRRNGGESVRLGSASDRYILIGIAML